MPWKPMNAEPDFHDALFEGVPAHMEAPLQMWAARAFGKGRELWRFMLAYDTATRNTEPIYPSHDEELLALYTYLGYEDFFRFLDFVVYMMISDDASYGKSLFDHESAVDLERVLLSNGSAWKVGLRDGLPGLERRVPAGVQEAADMAMAGSGSAGRLLSEAWHSAFGVSPDPEEAYEKAIKAVEAAAIPVVERANSRATLGTVIRVMRDQADWGLELADKAGASFGGPLRDMCQMLWEGQPSRHGANGYRKPTQAEAETAVLLAVPLVHWFYSGAVARRA